MPFKPFKLRRWAAARRGEREPIPGAAFALGWAGVLPFAVLAALVLADRPLPFLEPRAAILSYGAVILSFMGGVQWGLVTAPQGKAAKASGARFAASVLPALWGWFCVLFLPPAPALAGLAAGFAALLAYDLQTVQAGLASPWYKALRVQLTAAVVVLLLGAALF